MHKWSSVNHTFVLLAIGVLAVACSSGRGAALTPTAPLAVSEFTSEANTATLRPTFTATPRLILPTPTPLSATAALTITPAATARPVVFSTLEWERSKPLIALFEIAGKGEVVFSIVNLNTGTKQPLDFGASKPLETVDWFANGRELLVALSSEDGLKLARIDSSGNVLQEITSSNEDYPGGGILSNLDPLGDWVAYVKLKDRNLISSANVQVVSRVNPVSPYKLKDTGGACVDAMDIYCAMAWAPDGQHLAYSAYDADGIKQLYISEPDGSGQRQLTALTDPQAEIYTLRWSPNGDKIVFPVGNRERSLSLGIVFVEEGTFMTATSLNPSLTGFWWHNNDVVVADVNFIGAPLGSRKAIHWIDAETGKVLDSLSEAETPDKNILSPKPFGTPQRIGFFSQTQTGKAFYVYDLLTRSFERQPDFASEPGRVLLWEAAP